MKNIKSLPKQNLEMPVSVDQSNKEKELNASAQPNQFLAYAL